MSMLPSYNSVMRNPTVSGTELVEVEMKKLSQQNELLQLLAIIQLTSQSIASLNDEINKQDRLNVDLSTFRYVCDNCKNLNIGLMYQYPGLLVPILGFVLMVIYFK
ncbi:hypothetical protein DFJ63DRAFT_313448 [Scheffersomyces coipomensis]|uniref:uncharacterized protein n=1 Tax=Scheffersomyces coipomensis TaxID=1788519 RepID=UPI00315CBAC8